MIYLIGFGFIATVLSLQLYATFYHWGMASYLCWIAATSLIAVFYYGLDKGLSKTDWFKVRIPEVILDALAIVGGFPGVWLGRLVWNHKTNIREHPRMLAILLISTLVHGLLIYSCFMS